jgi:hypothetical protein
MNITATSRRSCRSFKGVISPRHLPAEPTAHRDHDVSLLDALALERAVGRCVDVAPNHR